MVCSTSFSAIDRSETVKFSGASDQTWWYAYRGSELVAKRGSRADVIDASHVLIDRLREPYTWATELFPPLVFEETQTSVPKSDPLSS